MPAAPSQRAETPRMAVICVVAFVLANLAFYLLSGSYFESHHEIVVGVGQVSTYTPTQMTHIRMTFAVFTGVVAAFGFLATLRPRLVGHAIPLVLGLVDLVAAFGAFANNAPGVVGMTLLVAGILLPALAHFSYRGSRPAWAFLVAMCGVFALVELFGAPKVRAAIDIGLWTAMILPGLNVVAVAALASLRGSYAERASD